MRSEIGTDKSSDSSESIDIKQQLGHPERSRLKWQKTGINPSPLEILFKKTAYVLNEMIREEAKKIKENASIFGAKK